MDDSVVGVAERIDLDTLRVADPRNWQRIGRHDHHALVENVVVFDVCAHCQRLGLVAAAEKNRRVSDPAIAMVAAAVDGSLTAYRRDALVNEAALA